MNIIKYQENGFVIARDVIDKDEIKNVFLALNKILENHVIPFNFPAKYYDFNLDSKLIYLKANHPSIFGSFYDRCQCLLELQKITAGQNLIESATKLLNIPKEVISVSSQAIRIDPPNDTKHTLGWHQESSYSFFNKNGKNGLVCWIPLQDTDSSNGTIIVSPNSFHDGWIEPLKEENPQGSSETRKPSNEITSKFNNLSVEVNKGDVVFMNMDLFHASGYNSSSSVRFTCRARFHNTLAEDFVSHRMTPSPSRSDLNDIFKNDPRLLLANN